MRAQRKAVRWRPDPEILARLHVERLYLERRSNVDIARELGLSE